MKKLLVIAFSFYTSFAGADIVFDSTVNEYQSLQDVSANFYSGSEELLNRQDPNGVFMKVYELVIRHTEQMLAQNQFEDPVWVQKVAVIYANYYRRAFFAYQTYQSYGSWVSSVASPWWLAFTENKNNQLAIPVQFILSTNAHIQNDLPFALIDSGADFSDRCYRDFQKIGVIFTGSFEESWRAIYRLDHKNRSEIERVMSSWMASNWIAIFRETAWKNAVKLSKGQTTPAVIEQQTYKAGLGYRTLDFWAR